MAYYHYRSSRTHIPPRNRSVWQTAEETTSLHDALRRYDVTEEDICNADPPIETRRRSYFGNCYLDLVVKVDDMVTLERQVKESKGIAKHGSKEAWEQHKKKEQEHEAEKHRMEAKAKEAAKKTVFFAAAKIKNVQKFCEMYLTLLSIRAGLDDVPDSIDDLRCAKTKAKKDWFLRDKDFGALVGEKDGRSIQYEVRHLIKAAEKRHISATQQHTFAPLFDKVKEDKQQLGIYVRYLHEKLEEKLDVHPTAFGAQVREKAAKSLAKKVSDNEDEITVAQDKLKVLKKKLSQNQQAVVAFKQTFPAVDGDNSKNGKNERSNPTDKENEEAAGCPQRKKHKLQPFDV